MPSRHSVLNALLPWAAVLVVIGCQIHAGPSEAVDASAFDSDAGQADAMTPPFGVLRAGPPEETSDRQLSVTPVTAAGSEDDAVPSAPRGVDTADVVRSPSTAGRAPSPVTARKETVGSLTAGAPKSSSEPPRSTIGVEPPEADVDDDGDFDPEVDGTRLYWGPFGKRFASIQVSYVAGGAGSVDVDGKMVRLRDGAVRHVRTIASAERAIDHEDGIDPQAQRRARLFHDQLLGRKYRPLASSDFEELEEGDEDADDAAVRVTEGIHKGLALDVEVIRPGRVRVWARKPGQSLRTSLGTAAIITEECWTTSGLDEDEIYPDAVRRGGRLCHEGQPLISGIWAGPGGKHVVVEVSSSPGYGCRADTYSTLMVGRLR